MDAQSVKTVEESARISGFNAHRCVKGHKRHLLVDTLGLPISVYVTPADMHDVQGARRLLAGLTFFVPRLKKIWADAAYRGKELADWCQAHGDWDLEVVERTPGVRGFRVLPKRWVVEGTQPHYRQVALDVHERAAHHWAHRAAEPPPCRDETASSSGSGLPGRWCAMSVVTAADAARSALLAADAPAASSDSRLSGPPRPRTALR
jgi:transposase